MNERLERQIEKMFARALAETNDEKLIAQIFEDVLEKKERKELFSRIACAMYLDKGREFENIESNLKIDAKKIKAVAKRMDGEGFSYLIRNAKAEEFAREWTGRLFSTIKSLIP